MIWVYRVLLLWVYAIYWGGLTLYTGFVLRVTHDVIADPMVGGMITRRVTEGLQILGALTIVLMILNGIDIFRKSRKYGYALFACTAILGCSLAGLFLVHEALDATIELGELEIIDRDAFDVNHQRYNQLTTIQWLAALAYLPIAILAWRYVDSAIANTTTLE